MKSQSPLLYEYCTTFYWILLNYFDAYRNLSTGVIKGNIYNEKDDKVKSGLDILGVVAS